VWAERYDRTLADMFAVQDEITNAVALAIEPAISRAEQRRAMGASPDNLAAWETYHRALSHLVRGSDAEVARARELFQRATELDELFAPAHALLAVVCLMETGRGLRKPQDSLRLAEMHVRRAMELDPYDSVGPTALAWLLLANGDHDAAVEQAERALALNQNDARPHYVKGRALAFSGRTVAARDALLTSLRLNPRDPFNQAVMAQIAFSYYLERDYAAAVEAVRRAIRDFAQFPMSYPWYAAALAQLGRTEQAQAVLGRVLAESPSAVELYTRGCPAWVRPQDHEHLLDGLRKAGWRAD
jgi:adenylate cyclase